ncbi:MAG: hypothetical protein WBR29_10800 [Gammaproteobacteria bacterium]
MTRQLLPVSGYSTNPATEVTTEVVGIVEFIEIDLPTGNLYLTNAHQSYTFGGNTYTPVTASGMPFGSINNYNECTDGVPRPMVLTLSGVDPTVIGDIVGNDVGWVNIVWSVGLLDKNNELVNSTPMFSAPLFLGDCTITLGPNTGTLVINAENLLADLQNRQAGMLQTVQDQQSRGGSGNTTFSKDTFYEFCASLTYVFLYWGMQGPSQLAIGGGGGSGGWWKGSGGGASTLPQQF